MKRLSVFGSCVKGIAYIHGRLHRVERDDFFGANRIPEAVLRKVGRVVAGLWVVWDFEELIDTKTLGKCSGNRGTGYAEPLSTNRPKSM